MFRLFGLSVATLILPIHASADETNPAARPEKVATEIKTAEGNRKATRIPTDAELEAIDVDSFGLVREFRGFNASLVGDIAVSPDGKVLLATCGARSVAHWEIATGKLLGSFQQQCWRASFLRGDDRAVIVTPQAAVLVRLGTGEELASCPLGGKSGKAIVATASQDDRIAFGLPSGEVIIWNPKKETTVRWATSDAKEIATLALSADGGMTFVQTEKSVRQFDSSSGREIRAFDLPEGKLRGMAVSPDGTNLVVVPDARLAFEGIQFLVCNPETGKRVAQLRSTDRFLGPSDARGLAITPDGNSVVAYSPGGPGFIHRWDLTSGEVTLRRPVQSYSRWIKLSPDCRHYFTHGNGTNVGGEGVIRMWQVDPWNDSADK